MIFKPAARYPADPRAVFILMLSVFSGLTALALNVAPDSLESLLPAWGVITWGATLGGGSAIALVGMAFRSINGIIVEQVGNVMVGVATLFYAAIVFFVVEVVDAEDMQTVGIILAWGLSCLVRWGQLQMLINTAYKRQVKQQLLSQVYAELEERAAEEMARRNRAPGRKP